MGTSTANMNTTYARPAAQQAANMDRPLGVPRGYIVMTLMTSSATDSPQIDSSATWPRFDVVSTEYQEQASAIAMRGTTARATAIPSALRAVREISLSINAHCPTKHSSA